MQTTIVQLRRRKLFRFTSRRDGHADGVYASLTIMAQPSGSILAEQSLTQPSWPVLLGSDSFHPP